VKPDSATQRTSSKGRVRIYDPPSLAGAAAKWVIRAIESALQLKGDCCLVLAGGTRWLPVYRQMAAPWLAERVDWRRVNIYFSNERCVPPDDPRSNFGATWSALLQHFPLNNAPVYRIRGEDPDPRAAARDYADQLPKQIDVLLLGVGSDGHTASLFPASPVLTERTRRIVMMSEPSLDVCRVTITPLVIPGAASVFVLAAGAATSDAVARALEGPWQPQHTPVQLARDAHWLIDEPAARGLRLANERAG